MKLRLDEAQGRGVGAKIALEGRMLGIALRVEEVITEYRPPAQKVWETIGEPRLLVIGSYRMGFTVEPQPTGSLLAVFIDYELPSGLWGVLGRLAGPFYARWCSLNMAKAVARRFA
ncbi:Polyketide cyclase/dehydrase/lipid transport protein [Novosphingobium lubricantis]